MTTHGWGTTSPSDNPQTATTLQMDESNELSNNTDEPKEGTKEHDGLLQENQKFSHGASLGEMMFACVSCRPDVGHAVTLMSKCGHNPSAFHCNCSKLIAEHPGCTKDWGITHHQKGESQKVPCLPIPTVPKADRALPRHPTDTTDAKLMHFVDVNDPSKRQSATRCATTHCGGATLHQSKVQSITASSSTEAEPTAVVTTVKNVECIWSVMMELEMPKPEPTPACKDNQLAIKMINASEPTGC